MASATAVSIFLFAFCGHVCGLTTPASAFKNVLEDVSSCRESCERTFPEHTYPESTHKPACYRGCRLFSILEFAEEDTDFNSTKEMCSQACTEAYKDKDHVFACNLGCQNEAPFAAQKRKEMLSEEANVHILTPVMAIRSMCEKFSKFARYRFSSWLVYMQGDNGQLYIFESQPEVDIFTMDPKLQGSIDFGKTSNDLETNLEVLSNRDSTDYPQRGDNLLDEGYGWLDCVSKKSGLPRWLLGVTLLLSALAMIWLCCATTATAPAQRVSSKKVAIYNDLAYLKDKKNFIHPVFVKSIPAKAVLARAADDDDDDLLILEDVKPQQSKI